MDPHSARPSIHFTPTAGWINDPLALTWHNDRYHLFFQHVPGRTTWAPECHWGHATSTDLLHWTEHDVALAPGDGDDGIWSGSLAVPDDGPPTIFYTSVSVPEFGVGRIRTATPLDDDWMHWEKGDVVVEAPPLDVVAFRDPFVMREAGGWRMLVGTALAGGEAAAASFTSTDLKRWTFSGLAASRNTRETKPIWTGALWECPQVFRLDDRDVMVTSIWNDDELHYVAYGIGTFADGAFRADTWGQLTYGPGYYAPSLFRDADGRACLIFWLRGAIDKEAGWASALSVPHVLSLEGDRLVARPHTTVGEPVPLTTRTITKDGDYVWNAESGALLQIGEPSSPSATIAVAGSELDVTIDGATFSIPLGSPTVRILVDEQTLEIFTDSAIGAAGAATPFAGRAAAPERPLPHPARRP